ncbi:VirB8/TrbF family protein [Succinatimonas hippei]|uniref:Conjugal transfer protein n=1 Tax=Succinatimonas hippei (strain DSM 22608 / JCM 16073 / KCTC 15190 / YIT 12066) TaxID=762983 RepID=E8LKH1_SUCHY|nr:VirB8/TrbF family protein [Succinatimonas hippei]EFY06958.1 conjugal transfer protein [Succinatimonas hippei YIT 12066]
MPAKIKVKKPLVYGNEKYNLALSELKQRLSLVITALIGTAFGFLCLGAYIVKSSQSQIIPYLVTVDTHGVVMAKGRVDLSQKIPDEAIAATLSNFIKNLRSVTSDSKVQRDFILETYAYVKEGSAALQKLNDFYNNENPFIKQQEGCVSVTINNVIAQEHQRIQIDWTEEHSGEFSSSQKQMFRAILAYSIRTQAISDPDVLLLNPLQVFVEDFAVSAVINH